MADLNGDRIPDVVNAGDNAEIERLLGLGGGAFAPGAYYATKNASRAALADVNGDGFPDVALANGQIFQNDGAGGLVLVETLMTEGIDLAAADANRDLQRDVVGFSPNGWLTVFHNLSACSGTGYAYGIGCPGSAGFVPELSARGCTSPGGTLTAERRPRGRRIPERDVRRRTRSRERAGRLGVHGAHPDRRIVPDSVPDLRRGRPGPGVEHPLGRDPAVDAARHVGRAAGDDPRSGIGLRLVRDERARAHVPVRARALAAASPITGMSA